MIDIRFRALDISKSWGRDVRNSGVGDISFFSQNSKNLSFENIDIITLEGVNDNAYPPQRKSFSLIRHFHDAFIKDYDWFMRTGFHQISSSPLKLFVIIFWKSLSLNFCKNFKYFANYSSKIIKYLSLLCRNL